MAWAGAAGAAAAVTLPVLRRGLLAEGAALATVVAPLEGFRSSSSAAVCLAVLRLDKKASAGSFAARWPGAGGRGIVDEPFLNKIQKAQSRLETEAALVG